MDKAHKQSKITRQQNKAIREAARAEREAQEKADKALVLEALRAVLKDPEATSAQRIYAVAVLDNMQYYNLVPYSVNHPGGADSDAVIADFVEKLRAYQAAESNAKTSVESRAN